MGLDCQSCDDGLVEFLYGELDDGRAAAFEQHLRACPKCAAAAEKLRQTREVFAQLEEAEPPPLSSLDAVLAAAEAKAEEMSRRAPAEEPSRPTLWESFIELFRGAALRPALGTAFTVLIVAGVGLLIWSERPEPLPSGAATHEELTPIPSSELTPQHPEEIVPAPTPAPEPAPTPSDLQPVEEPPPSDVVSPEPPRPAKAPPVPERQPNRSTDRQPQPQRRETPRQEAGSTSQASRNDVYLDNAESAPLVVEAERVSESAPPPATQAPSRPAATPNIPVIPTPPLPQAVSPAQRQQAYGNEQQGPTPATASAPSPGVQQPTRVATPGGQTQYDRGMEAYRTGRYRDAADELDAFVRSPSAPTNLVPTGMHHLAMSQQRTGNFAAAARSYEQLLQRFPSYNRRPQAMLEAARVYARLGSFDRAQRLLNQLAAIPGWSGQAQTELARLQHLRAGQSGQLGPAAADEAADEVEAEMAAEPSGD